MEMRCAISEHSVRLQGSVKVFILPDAAPPVYRATLRVDTPKRFYAEALRDVAAFWERDCGLNIGPAPEAAMDPVCSTWTSFHKVVSEAEVEAECRAAARLGLKTFIMDDGRQLGSLRGDWGPDPEKFPDFPAHVRRIQALGMEYLPWTSFPFAAEGTRSHERFRDKMLSDGLTLDPRFVESAEHDGCAPDRRAHAGPFRHAALGRRHPAGGGC